MRDPRVTNEKPYRPNVGIAMFNADGLVLIGRRFRDDGPEIIFPGLEWQMPQGGVDPGEDLRERHVANCGRRPVSGAPSISARTAGSLTNSRPMTAHSRIGWRTSAASARNGSRAIHRPRTTNRSATPRNGQAAEFDAWRWERLDRVADLVVPFRRDVYREVARTFAAYG